MGEGDNGQVQAKHLRSKHVEVGKGLQVQRLVWTRFPENFPVFDKVHLSESPVEAGWDDISRMNWEEHILDLLLSPTEETEAQNGGIT